MEEFPCSNNSGLNIHSETPHFEDFGRSKMCMERVSYGEDQKLIRTSERLGQRPPGEVSDRSFPLGFNISWQNISGEEMGRVRLSLRGLLTSLVHEPLIRISREPWELLAESFARSFPIGFNIHRVTMYLEDLDRARIRLKPLSEDLVHKALPEVCSEPWKEQYGETTRSIIPTLEIHSQVEYVKGFDRSRTCDFRVPFEAGQPKLHGYDHRGRKLTCSYSACLSASGFIFHRQSVYGKANDRGKTNLVRAPLSNHPYTTIETERHKEPTSHSHSSRLGNLGFLICSENTYKEVLGQGKPSLDQSVLRDGPQGPVPPYTGRTDLSTPSGHWDHHPYLLGHVLMKPTRPLESSASTSFVASASRPRTLPCDLTGEVLSFSLKLLLFPFDPGIDKVLRTKLQQRGGYDRCMAMAHVPTVPSGTQNRNTGAEYVPEHGSGTEHVPEHVPEHRTRNIPRIHPRFSLPKQTSQAAFIGSLDNQAMSQNPEHHHQAPNITIKPSMEQVKSGEHSKWFMKTLGRLHSFGKLDHVCLHSQVMWRHPQVIEGIGTLFPTPGLSHRVYREGFNEAMHFDASHLIPIQSLTWKHSGLVKGLKR